jgi:hypothetical protein
MKGGLGLGSFFFVSRTWEMRKTLLLIFLVLS